MARVSVLLASFNQPRYLPGAIQSVLDQTYTDWQLTVLDNGSTEPEVRAILGDAARDERVRVYRFNPSDAERAAAVGYAVLFNWGVANTDSELICYLCDDDLYTPDRLERMVNEIDRGHQVVYGAQDLIGENDEFLHMRPADHVIEDAYHIVDLNSVMQTRDSFMAAGGLPTDSRMWADADAHLFLQLQAHGHRFWPVPGPPTDRKRMRDDSVSSRIQRGEALW